MPRPAIGSWVLSSGTSLYYLGLLLAACVLAVAYNVAHSRLGRAWLAIREDEIAARAAGINTVTFKLRAYMMGALLGGIGGSFFAVKVTAVDPTSFTFVQSVNILMVVVLGGMGSLPGIVLGAAVIVGLPEALRALPDPSGAGVRHRADHPDASPSAGPVAEPYGREPRGKPRRPRPGRRRPLGPREEGAP